MAYKLYAMSMESGAHIPVEPTKGIKLIMKDRSTMPPSAKLMIDEECINRMIEDKIAGMKGSIANIKSEIAKRGT